MAEAVGEMGRAAGGANKLVDRHATTGRVTRPPFTRRERDTNSQHCVVALSDIGSLRDEEGAVAG